MMEHFGIQTYIDGGLHTGLDTSALVDGSNFADSLTSDHSLADGGSHLLGVGELVLDGLGALHGDQDTGVGEAVGHGKVNAVLENIGNDDRLGTVGLADSSGEQANGTSTEDQYGGASGEGSAITGVPGDGERLGEGTQVEGDVIGEPGSVSENVLLHVRTRRGRRGLTCGTTGQGG